MHFQAAKIINSFGWQTRTTKHQSEDFLCQCGASAKVLVQDDDVGPGQCSLQEDLYIACVLGTGLRTEDWGGSTCSENAVTSPAKVGQKPQAELDKQSFRYCASIENINSSVGNRRCNIKKYINGKTKSHKTPQKHMGKPEKFEQIDQRLMWVWGQKAKAHTKKDE